MIGRTFFSLAISAALLNAVIQLFFLIYFNHPRLISLSIDEMELLLWITTITSTGQAIFFILYCHWKGFRLLAFASLISAIGYPFLMHAFWQSMNWQFDWEDYDTIYRLDQLVYIFICIATFITKARERKWLRNWAVYCLFLSLVSLAFSYYGELGTELQRISELLAYSSIILIVFDVLNYLDEKRDIKISDEGVLDDD